MKAMLLALLLTTTAAAAETTEVERWLEARVADGSIGAATFALVEGGELRTSAFGKVGDAAPTADTQFQAGSITKVFTNLLLAEMVEDASMSGGDRPRTTTTLADAFGKALAPRNAAVAKITFEQLATHTSGLPRLPANLDAGNLVDPYGHYDANALVRGLNGTREKQPLGRFYSYSNFGAAVLGEALGRIDGRGYEAALKDRVLRKLEVAHTGFTPEAGHAQAIEGGKRVDAWRFDAFAPAGALWTTANDLAHVVGAYFGWTNSLLHDKSDDAKRLADAGPFGVSRVWHLAPSDGDPILWHNGATRGFHSVVALRLDSQRGIVVLVAGDADPTDVVLRALGHVPAKPPAAKVDASVTGQYQLAPTFGVGIFERNGVLFEQVTGQMAIALHAVGDDWYALGEVDASMHFVREDGKVVALELAQNGVVQRIARVADVATAAAKSEIELAADVLDDYAGEYQLAPGVAIAVRTRTGGIEAMLTGQSWFPVYARAKDRFFYRVVDAELEFERGDDGKVVAVTLHQGGLDQRAPRRR